GIGLLETTVGQSISYIQWFIWGMPFAIVITLLSIFVIKLVLWPKDGLGEIESVQTEEKIMFKKQLNEKEKKTVILILLLIVGWMTESIHGYDIAFVTMIGAGLIM